MVTEYQVDLPTTLGSATELRIAFAADFHAGPLTHPTLLARACRALHDARPDLLLLGGDFVSVDTAHVDSLARWIEAINAPFGHYAVLGNHDLLTDADRLVARLECAGIRLLTNRNLRLPHPYENVWLCGLDDHLLGKPDPSAVFAGADGVRILLMHQPSGLLDAGDERLDLAFCGHTHGGQIALPGGIPIYLPHGHLARRFAYGKCPLNDGTLIVTRGVGYTYLPVRLFASPEVVVCVVHTELPVPLALGPTIR